MSVDNDKGSTHSHSRYEWKLERRLKEAQARNAELEAERDAARDRYDALRGALRMPRLKHYAQAEISACIYELGSEHGVCMACEALADALGEDDDAAAA